MVENDMDGKVQEVLPVFTNEDLCINDNAFTWLFSFKDQPDEFAKKDIWLQNYSAMKLKINDQKYKTLKNLFIQKIDQDDNYQPNVTIFPNQPMELSCGKYTADKTGVSYISEKGTFVEVISHPIMPVKKYVNIDNGSVQVELAFSRGRNGWKNIEPVTKETISASNKITVLANQDIAVTSENAKEVIKFLSFLESENIDRIPVQHSTSRLGWVGNRFIPYDSDLVFDTSTGNFAEIFSAVHEQGDYEKWKSVALPRRKRDADGNLPFRMATAASFASPLVEKLGLLCFCMELEGDAGSGKSVCLEFASSIWGDPRLGKWTQTLDTTKTALENLAGFANSLPLCLDEQQIVEDEKNKTNLSSFIYMFCSKTGRNRAMKTGGLQKKNNWNNIAIMTGEQEATSSRSKAGSLLRVIDVPFQPGEKIFKSKAESAPFMRTIEQNFGFAGKEFIQKIQEEDMSALQERLDKLSIELEKTASGKQANSGALLILADELAERYIFHDGIVLTVEEVAMFLKSDEEVNTNARLYQALCDWLVSNKAQFIVNSTDIIPKPWFGKVEGETFYLMQSKLTEFCQSYNCSEKLFLKWAYKNGAIVDHRTESDRHPQAQVRVGKDKYFWWEIRLGVLDQDSDDNNKQETSVPAGYTQVDDMDLPF